MNRSLRVKKVGKKLHWKGRVYDSRGELLIDQLVEECERVCALRVLSKALPGRDKPYERLWAYVTRLERGIVAVKKTIKRGLRR